ncbi:hypothetical protein [Cupriavidus sp. D39]|uniref:hypothetical protein n=1 Tax=Cupriavidus sp. D39 TaxID=2997877 RepID=UPI0022702FAA|nr:hypothetical protein [Cupriavidus sp. D39]MCY0856155.1 hypothetical protein [Cupriavidus sp. D39]
MISGTDKDGPHFHSGAYSFVYNDPTSVSITPTGLAYINTSGGCQNCLPSNVQTTASYTATGNSAAQFLDPLLYAAKWGAFKDQNASGTPDLVAEWDNYDANGNPGADGIPDNYFYVTNPANLQNALNNAFLNILQTSSAASVATNSSSLNTGSVVYQAQFNGANWSGQLLALSVDANGNINTTSPNWDARSQLAAQSKTPGSRNILTFDATATAREGFHSGGLELGSSGCPWPTRPR